MKPYRVPLSVRTVGRMDTTTINFLIGGAFYLAIILAVLLVGWSTDRMGTHR